MLEFHPLTLRDLPKLRHFFGYSKSRICDTTPGTVFIWRDMYQTEWAVYNGSLYFKVEYPGLHSTFTLPLGGGRTEHYHQIAEYCCQHHQSIAFYPVPKDELDLLQKTFPNSRAEPTRDTFDYLYRGEDLKFFRGKKLSGQRNHVNRFLKTYSNWIFRPITLEDLPRIGAFLDRYSAEREKDMASFREDLTKTREILAHYELYDMLGGVLLVEDEIVGFSLGEVIGDTLFIHIEKADRSYHGGYQMLVAQYAQYFARDGISFLNREDDAGDLGLRTSKLSYHPITMLEKYVVIVSDPCKLL